MIEQEYFLCITKNESATQKLDETDTEWRLGIERTGKFE